MEWTNDTILNFIKVYENYPVLWDNTHKFYKIIPKKSEAWEAISQELGIDVVDLKRKMTSLLATYRKVRQRFATVLKRGTTADDVDSSPAWFAYKAFAFLQNTYQPRSALNTEEGSEVGGNNYEPQNEENGHSDEGDPLVMDNQEVADKAHPEELLTSSLPTKKRKLFVAPKKIMYKRFKSEDPRTGLARTALQMAINKKKDEFDSFGEYIANTLRTMDQSTRAYVKKEFGEIIFKAETGVYDNHFVEPTIFWNGSSTFWNGSSTFWNGSSTFSPEIIQDLTLQTHRRQQPVMFSIFKANHKIL